MGKSRKDILVAVDKFFTSPSKWCKGQATGGKNNERCCITGAISKFCGYSDGAGYDYVANDKAYHRELLVTTLLDSMAPEVDEYSGKSVVAYNDHDKTTFKDIKSLIRKAIRKVSV